MKVVQIDVNAEEMGSNMPNEASLLGDCGMIVAQLTSALKREGWRFQNKDWWKALNDKVIACISMIF